MAKNKKERQKARREQKKKAQQARRLIGAAVALAFVGLVAYFTWQETAGGNTLPAESVADPTLGIAITSETNDSSIIEIVEYSDFGCPACRSWHNSGTRDQVMAQFGDRVRFVWRDFPVITAQSPKAAEAGHCASAQGKFWEFHDHVYENFEGLSRSQLTTYATTIGLNVDTFETCMDEEHMLSKVRANEQAARRLGMRGTPGFTVNGQVLTGPPSFEMLMSLIQGS